MGIFSEIFKDTSEWDIRNGICRRYGVSEKLGVPQTGWFLLGKIPSKWMMNRPISGNAQIDIRASGW